MYSPRKESCFGRKERNRARTGGRTVERTAVRERQKLPAIPGGSSLRKKGD